MLFVLLADFTVHRTPDKSGKLPRNRRHRCLSCLPSDHDLDVLLVQPIHSSVGVGDQFHRLAFASLPQSLAYLLTDGFLR